MHCRGAPRWLQPTGDAGLQFSRPSQHSLAGTVCQALPPPALLCFLLQLGEDGAQLGPTGDTAGKTTTGVSNRGYGCGKGCSSIVGMATG